MKPVLKWMNRVISAIIATTLIQINIPVADAEQSAIGWKDIAVSNELSLGTKNDGTVWAWGATNFQGQFGNGERGFEAGNTYFPVQVKGLTEVIGVHTGSKYGAAIKNDGTVWAWGNIPEKMIDPSFIHEQESKPYVWNRSYPGKVHALSQIVGLGGITKNLAIKSDGTLWRWGELDLSSNNYITYQLNFKNVTSVASNGSGDFVVLEKDGTVWTIDRQYQDSIQIEGLSDITAVALSNSRVYALQSNGSVWESGLVKGRVNSTPPRVIKGISNVVDIQATLGGPLLLKKNGTVWTSGSNTAGELGIGTYGSSEDLVKVRGLTDIVKIAASGDGWRAMAIREDGTLWSWGAGPVGDGTKWNRLEPVWIPSSSAEEPPAPGDFIGVKLNGVIVDLVHPPVFHNETIMVPVNALSELWVDARIEREPDTYTVTILIDQSVTVFTPGSSEAYINGTSIHLDTPPVVMNDTIFVPLTIIAESFGMELEWNDDTRTVSIFNVEYKPIAQERIFEKNKTNN